MISSNQKKIAVILGARPNFIKAASFLKESKKNPEFKFTLIHTGQHFDDNMSKVFFEETGIPKPDIHLNIQGVFHTEKIGKMFNELKKIFTSIDFDATVVFGDVNSTLAGALATIKSTKNNCKLIHIEAGLRSHDRRMPEEINRVIIDHLSDILFTTEYSANTNLIVEGIDENKIHFVGNLMIETIEIFWDRIITTKISSDLNLLSKQYLVTTVHRQENIDSKENLKTILLILNKINENLPVVFPVHPGTKKKIHEYGLENLLQQLKTIEPLGYLEFMKLLTDSKGIITDSGGIQEETSHLGIPCCTLRDNTERPITIELGSNKLFPIHLESIEKMKIHLAKKHFASRHIPLWDDKVSQRIFTILRSL